MVWRKRKIHRLGLTCWNLKENLDVIKKIYQIDIFLKTFRKLRYKICNKYFFNPEWWRTDIEKAFLIHFDSAPSWHLLRKSLKYNLSWKRSEEALYWHNFLPLKLSNFPLLYHKYVEKVFQFFSQLERSLCKKTCFCNLAMLLLNIKERNLRLWQMNVHQQRLRHKRNIQKCSY